MFPLYDDAPKYGKPYLTYLVLALNVVVFLFEISLAPRGRYLFLYHFGVVPAEVGRWLAGGGALDTALLPLVTSMFLHASWLHLIANMWALWIFGDNVESYLGQMRYLLLYLGSGIAGSVLHTALNWGSAVPSVGASGAIAGVMGAYFLLYPTARVLTLIPFFFIYLTWLPAWLVLGYWFVAQFLSGAATSISTASQSGGGVAFWAHVGGFLTGVALIKLFPGRPQPYRFH